MNDDERQAAKVAICKYAEELGYETCIDVGERHAVVILNDTVEVTIFFVPDRVCFGYRIPERDISHMKQFPFDKNLVSHMSLELYALSVMDYRFWDALKKELSALYEKEKLHNPFDFPLQRPPTGYPMVDRRFILHENDEHWLFLVPESSAICLHLMFKHPTHEGDSIVAACRQIDPVEIAKELFPFLRSLKKDDTAGRLMYKMHAIRLSFNWFTDEN